MIGYHASHEQFAPSELLRLSVAAEAAGFAAINCSDHFFPWSRRQGHSGYSFAWLGAAMARTSVPFSVVCAPGYRNHPAIVAQAAATLSEMFPGRFAMSLGSGEALNEGITGERWPKKDERNGRLRECADVMKRLLAGEELSHRGRITVEEAKLYTLPPEPPLLLGAAVTKETAAWMGSWADGLITVHQPHAQLKEVVEAYRQNGGAGKPVFLKVQLSYARTRQEALTGAHDQWRTNIFHSTVLADLTRVAQFDALGEYVQPEELEPMVRISADPEEHLDWIRKDLELGFDRIFLHNVNREQERFLHDFGERVLPHLK
ncbi:MAG: TIGR03885 family FMN-dependent LLM class oxidoreductase [Chitinophagaceae bacterium]|nr:MAG: TIGR03885 family FMN-dependent LLM class oxidoreductase [Chitinophagaceae bacterium]